MSSKKKAKKKQYKRSDANSNIFVQSRDLDIFQDLLRMRALTQKQIEKLYFPSKNAAQKRLRGLYDNGYIDRAIYPFRIQGGGRATNLYTLDRKGAEALAAYRPVFRLTWHHSYKSLSDEFLRHAIPLNDFMILIRIAAPKNDFEQLTNWFSETELRRIPEHVYIKNHKGFRKRKAIIPDGFFALQRGDKYYPFFVEWDGTTQSEKVIQEKVKKYVAYFESGQYTDRYKFKLFRVIFVAKTETRIKTLKSWVDNMQIEGKGAFFFASLGSLTTGNIFIDTVWMRGGHKARTTLL